MNLFPAVDLIGGKAVRLKQGDYEKMTVFGDDPVAAAQKFEEEGAKYLHVVDLEGAKDGGRPAEAVIKKIIKETSLKVEVGGGIRSEEAIAAYLDAGAFRVILGTAAAEDEGFTREAFGKYGDRIAVGADARDGIIATRGWLSSSGETLVAFAKRMEGLGAKTLIVTDISRDGVSRGANLGLYRDLVASLSLGVVASGGIATAGDISALREIGVSGAILGRALYTGELSLADALCAAGDRI